MCVRVCVCVSTLEFQAAQGFGGEATLLGAKSGCHDNHCRCAPPRSPTPLVTHSHSGQFWGRHCHSDGSLFILTLATTPVPCLPSHEASGLGRGTRDRAEPCERIPPSSLASRGGLNLMSEFCCHLWFGRVEASKGASLGITWVIKGLRPLCWLCAPHPHSGVSQAPSQREALASPPWGISCLWA